MIAGRPLAAELVSARSSCGSGLRRLVRAWASTLLTCWSSPADDEAAILAARGFGVGFNKAFCIVYTDRDDGYTSLVCVEVWRRPSRIATDSHKLGRGTTAVYARQQGRSIA